MTISAIGHRVDRLEHAAARQDAVSEKEAEQLVLDWWRWASRRQQASSGDPANGPEPDPPDVERAAGSRAYRLIEALRQFGAELVGGRDER